MIVNSEFILNFLLNSVWQIPILCALAALGSLGLRSSSAQYRHKVWVATLVLCLIAPIVSAAQLIPAVRLTLQSSSTGAKPTSIPRVIENSNHDQNDITPLDNVKKRSFSVVISTTPRIVQLLGFAYVLFIAVAISRFGRLWFRKEKLRASVVHEGLTASVERATRQCQMIFGVRHVQVGRSETARVPYTIGVRRPLIVLPDSFCSNVDDETVLSVIAHEMAHVRRRDFLTKLICELVTLPISFHPFTSFAKRRIDRERELACDELVATHVLVPKTYARSLLMAADLSVLPPPNAMTLSIFDGQILEERIMKLTKSPLPGRRFGRTITGIVVCVLSASAISLSVFGVELRTRVESPLSPATTASVIDEQQPIADRSVQDQSQLRRQLESSNAQERAQAACTAGHNGDLEAIPSLIAMLADDTKVEMITCWNSGRWSPALDTFKHPSPGEQAAIALASMGRVAFTPLVNQLESSNATVRRNAAWAIGELTNMLPGERTGAIPQLVALLSDSDAWVRMAAARTIGEVRDTRATEMLIVTLGDSDWRVRQMAAWALSEMKDDRAVKALCNTLLIDARAEVRRGAAEALGEIRSNDALPFLKQALNDPEATVRAKVSWAIEEIEDSDG